jgi:hypothetical protein
MLLVEVCTVSNFSAAANKFSELAHKRHLQTLAEYTEFVNFKACRQSLLQLGAKPACTLTLQPCVASKKTLAQM